MRRGVGALAALVCRLLAAYYVEGVGFILGLMVRGGAEMTEPVSVTTP